AQYDALSRTYHYMLGKKDEILDFYKNRNINPLVFTGCGSSYEISRSTSFSASIRLKTKSIAMAAGDIMINHLDYKNVLEKSLLCVISRSGSTSEILNAVDIVKQNYGASVLSIVCANNTSLAKKSDLVLEMPWAFDESVCQTRTVTNLYTANLMLIAFLSDDNKLLDDIGRAIAMGNRFIEQWAKKIEAASCGNWDNAVILADGEIHGLSQEGALAFKEICNTHSNYYHVLDVRHGPMVRIDEKTFVIVAFSSREYSYQKDLVDDLIKSGATVIVYSPEEIEPIDHVALHVHSSAAFDPAVMGIHFIFICQIASLTHASVTGIDPDNPENLSPWIEL
ncbi:MAG TPA: SIS domain-containing protein, partial [Anaerovoracaceae bacterium]|nr:SIS domain-containing protein [Anaerovoracaceae bacterium]